MGIRFIKTGCYFILFIVFSLAAISFLSAATYHVDPLGDDTRSASSAQNSATPWLTIQKAANIAIPGDIMLVHPGDYSERVRMTGSGSVGFPIVFQAMGKVVLKGFDLVGDFITVDGFEITNNEKNCTGYVAGLGGITISGNNAVVTHNYIHDLAYAGIFNYNSLKASKATVAYNRIVHCQGGIMIRGSNWLVENNEIDHVFPYCENWDTDYVRVFGQNHVIRGNYLHGSLLSDLIPDPNDAGNYIQHMDCFQSWAEDRPELYSMENVLIEGNICLDSSQGVYVNGRNYQSYFHDITIRNNVFARFVDRDLPRVGAAISTLETPNSTIVNNTIALTGGGIVAGNTYRNPGVLTIPNQVIKNNIIYGRKSAAMEVNNLQPLDRGDVIDNNLYINRLGKSNTYVSGPNDVILQNPQFVDENNILGPDGIPFTEDDGLRLRSTSPARDKGDDTVASTGFSQDILGTPRTQGPHWDIGAYESENTPVASFIYYVDFDNGNDSNDGLTQTTAWQTLPGSMQTTVVDTSNITYLSTLYGTSISQTKKVKPGTVFKLKSGSTYSIADGGYVWINRAYYEDTATAANPIVFERDTTWGSGSVVFDAAGMNTPIALVLTQINGLTFDGKGAGGIVIQNASLGGLHAKEKAGSGDANLDLSLKDLKFFNNGTNYLTDAAGSGSGQLNIRKAVGVIIDGLELDGNNRYINGLLMGDNHKTVTGAIVMNSRSHHHKGDLENNDAGIGFKAMNSQITFKNCESFQNLKGWDLGEQSGDNVDIRYKIINANSHHNAWGINFNAAADINYAGNNQYFIINSIIWSNTEWGSNIYAGPYHVFLVNNVYAGNGNVSFDAGNLRISPNGAADPSPIQATLYNNIFYKPNTTSGANYMNTGVGNAFSSASDTDFSLDSDFNSWIQNTTERFARWNAFASSVRDLTGNTEFLYGAEGPGHSSGKWFSLEDEPGKGTGHLGADAHSKGTGSSDPTLPPFTDATAHDYSLTEHYFGKDLSTYSWYIPEMGFDRAGRQRSSWDMGAYEYCTGYCGPSQPPVTGDPGDKGDGEEGGGGDTGGGTDENNKQSSGDSLFLPFKNVFNPLQGVLTIQLTSNIAEANLRVYDKQGGEVRRLEISGDHAEWDGRNSSGQTVASGTYLVVLKSGDKIQKKRVMVVK